MQSGVFSKVGFNNSYGENNCFLNVALQALMSLSCVRNQMQYLATHCLDKISNLTAKELLVRFRHIDFKPCTEIGLEIQRS